MIQTVLISKESQPKFIFWECDNLNPLSQVEFMMNNFLLWNVRGIGKIWIWWGENTEFEVVSSSDQLISGWAYCNGKKFSLPLCMLSAFIKSVEACRQKQKSYQLMLICGLQQGTLTALKMMANILEDSHNCCQPLKNLVSVSTIEVLLS